jgi:hypothetical protein
MLRPISHNDIERLFKQIADDTVAEALKERANWESQFIKAGGLQASRFPVMVEDTTRTILRTGLSLSMQLLTNIVARNELPYEHIKGPALGHVINIGHRLATLVDEADRHMPTLDMNKIRAEYLTIIDHGVSDFEVGIIDSKPAKPSQNTVLSMGDDITSDGANPPTASLSGVGAVARAGGFNTSAFNSSAFNTSAAPQPNASNGATDGPLEDLTPPDHQGLCSIEARRGAATIWATFPSKEIAAIAATAAISFDRGSFSAVKIRPETDAPHGTKRYDNVPAWFFDLGSILQSAMFFDVGGTTQEATAESSASRGAVESVVEDQLVVEGQLVVTQASATAGVDAVIIRGDGAAHRTTEQLDEIIGLLGSIEEAMKRTQTAGIGHNKPPDTYYDDVPPLMPEEVLAVKKVATLYRARQLEDTISEDEQETFEFLFSAFGKRLDQTILWMKRFPEKMWTALVDKAPEWTAKYALKATITGVIIYENWEWLARVLQQHG